jgi:hypothetical protein
MAGEATLMSDELESYLGRLTPRGAPTELRERVLAEVSRVLLARPPRRWTRWAGVALAASFLLAVGLNLAVEQAQQARLAEIYGPESVPRALTEVTRAVESVADAPTAAWFRQELLNATRRPARLDTWTEYYSRTLKREGFRDASVENGEAVRRGRRGAGGAFLDGQRSPGFLHGRAA